MSSKQDIPLIDWMSNVGILEKTKGSTAASALHSHSLTQQAPTNEPAAAATKNNPIENINEDNEQNLKEKVLLLNWKPFNKEL